MGAVPFEGYLEDCVELAGFEARGEGEGAGCACSDVAVDSRGVGLGIRETCKREVKELETHLMI